MKITHTSGLRTYKDRTSILYYSFINISLVSELSFELVPLYEGELIEKNIKLNRLSWDGQVIQ